MKKTYVEQLDDKLKEFGVVNFSLFPDCNANIETIAQDSLKMIASYEREDYKTIDLKL